jgi:predicted kinase
MQRPAGAHRVSRPTLVVVAGPPGSGKTTLAHALAAAIPCPAICRDEIKEGMMHAHGGYFDAAQGDPLTQRTFPLFFEVLRTLVSGGVTVVAEAAFQDGLWRRGLEPLLVCTELRIVNCRVDAVLSYERATDRGDRRLAHGDSALRAGEEEWARRIASFEWISIPSPSIDVDTTDGYNPGMGALVAFVNRSAR